MVAKNKVDELREAIEKRKMAEENMKQETEVSEEIETDSKYSELEERLAVAEEKSTEHQEKFLRIMAEFDNFRKRSEREQSDAITFANEKLLKELMPVLDHLDEALARVPDGDLCSPDLRSFAEGVLLTRNQLMSALSGFGFKEVDAEPGIPFNPAVHEAIAQIDTEDVESNCIVARHRRGYTLQSRLLRAALVAVAK